MPKRALSGNHWTRKHSDRVQQQKMYPSCVTKAPSTQTAKSITHPLHRSSAMLQTMRDNNTDWWDVINIPISFIIDNNHIIYWSFSIAFCKWCLRRRSPFRMLLRCFLDSERLSKTSRYIHDIRTSMQTRYGRYPVDDGGLNCFRKVEHVSDKVIVLQMLLQRGSQRSLHGF